MNAKRILFGSLILLVLAGLAGCGINPKRELTPQPAGAAAVLGKISSLKSFPFCTGRVVIHDVRRLIQFMDETGGRAFYFSEEFPVWAHPSQEVVITSKAWILALEERLGEAGYKVVPACGGEKTIRADLEFAQYLNPDRTKTVLLGRIILALNDKEFLRARDDLFVLGKIQGKPRPLTEKDIGILVNRLARITLEDVEQVFQMVVPAAK